MDRQDGVYLARAAEARGLERPFPWAVHRASAAWDALADARREASDAAPAAAVPFRDDAERSAVHAQAYHPQDVDQPAAIPWELQAELAVEARCRQDAVQSGA